MWLLMEEQTRSNSGGRRQSEIRTRTVQRWQWVRRSVTAARTRLFVLLRTVKPSSSSLLPSKPPVLKSSVFDASVCVCVEGSTVIKLSHAGIAVAVMRSEAAAWRSAVSPSPQNGFTFHFFLQNWRKLRSCLLADDSRRDNERESQKS